MYLSSFDNVYLEDKPVELRVERKVADRGNKKGADDQSTLIQQIMRFNLVQEAVETPV